MTLKIEQQLSPVSTKRKRELLFELEKRERKKLRSFQKLLDEPEPSLQSECAESEQCK